MPDAIQEKREFEQLDALTGRSPRKLFALSPNDVLVQVSLPLVLILAIATRLMMMAQSLASVDSGPIILDLWKQQLILRVEQTLADWERGSGLAAFSSFDRVRWEREWPADEAFGHLCRTGQALGDLETLKRELYREALRLQPEAGAGEDARTQFAFLQVLYDPLESDPSLDADSVPPECRITDERRAYALKHIEERCLKWKIALEDLQWAAIEQVMARLPAEESLTDRRLKVQMNNVASALAERGYPLLPSIVNEYGGRE
jgi:hypothetical protein